MSESQTLCIQLFTRLEYSFALFRLGLCPGSLQACQNHRTVMASALTSASRSPLCFQFSHYIGPLEHQHVCIFMPISSFPHLQIKKSHYSEKQDTRFMEISQLPFKQEGLSFLSSTKFGIWWCMCGILGQREMDVAGSLGLNVQRQSLISNSWTSGKPCLQKQDGYA